MCCEVPRNYVCFCFITMLGLLPVGTQAIAAAPRTMQLAENAAADHRNRRQSEDDCRQDVKCYSQKGKFYALSLCKPAIERAATYGLTWTDGLFETAFSDVSWKDRESGLVEFRGDRATMQNQYGAWQNASYSCVISVPTGSMVDVNLRPGKL